jgi:hypothetical protein
MVWACTKNAPEVTSTRNTHAARNPRRIGHGPFAAGENPTNPPPTVIIAESDRLTPMKISTEPTRMVKTVR